MIDVNEQIKIILKGVDEIIGLEELREKLLPKKIIIRDCNSFDGLSEYYFRVCILKPEENKTLIKTLKSIFK